ncbi:winged helix-turn-helix domain-containing protein [Haloplanus salinarum]|jgi:Mn-dependent DtxR family transcriptional regulator
MRQRADWMVPSDDAILEYLADAGEVPPAVIGRNIDSHPNYVGERCRTLASYGLVDRREDGYYALTDYGRRYLSGDLDATQLTSDST